jgi:RNA-directed DNA polymerase
MIPSGGGNPRNLFHGIVSISNLLASWKEFKRGKTKKKDVFLFEVRTEEHLFQLHAELISKAYRHSPYSDFYVCDPKRRHIHKSIVRDRIVHQAVFRKLYPIFDKNFIYDSYSSRIRKGTHLGVVRLECACRKESNNWRKPVYALKCDVRKFFDSIEHGVLRKLIRKKISDTDTLWLIEAILESFEKSKGKGLPLGNVTSQLFGNIYLNELDQYAKHVLKAKHYFRYCDDFVIVHDDREFLEDCLQKVKIFLKEKLSLDVHPDKVCIRKLKQGIDFVGYVVSPHAKILRTATKKRMLRKVAESHIKYKSGHISKETFQSIIASYMGVLSHCKGRKLRNKILRC